MTWPEVIATLLKEQPGRPFKYIPDYPDDYPDDMRNDPLLAVPGHLSDEPADDKFCVRALVNRALRLERLLDIGAPQIIIESETLLVAKALLWLSPPGDETMELDRDRGNPAEPFEGESLWPGPDPGPPDLRIVE